MFVNTWIMKSESDFQSVLRKVTPEDAPKISDQVMSALLRMLSSSAQIKTGGVQEDVLLAISTLVEGMYKKQKGMMSKNVRM